MKRVIVCVLLAALAAGSMVLAEDAPRAATVTDETGVKTQLTNLTFAPIRASQKFAFGLDAVAVIMKNGEIAVSLDNLKSIEVKEGSATVSCYWNGQEMTLVGSLENGTFNGESEFGHCEVPAGKVTALQLASPSRNTPKQLAEFLLKDKDPIKATLIFKDDTEVAVDHVQRIYRSSSSTDYFYKDFCFLRGDAKFKITFDKLRSIDFADTTVTVTLKSGTSSPGKLTSDWGERADGFTGFCEKGEFYVESKYIKKIVFGDR